MRAQLTEELAISRWWMCLCVSNEEVQLLAADARMRGLSLLTVDGRPPFEFPCCDKRTGVSTRGELSSVSGGRTDTATLVLGDLSGIAKTGAAYVAWPSLEDPVLVASADCPKDRLLWFATSMRRRVVGQALRLGLTGERFWISGHRTPLVAETWTQITGHRASGVSVSNGTAGANRRPVAVVLDSSGNPTAFARSAYTPDEISALFSEVELLSRLSEVAELRESIPQVWGPCEVGEATVMYMKGQPGLVHGPKRLEDRHLAFLSALSLVDQQERALADSGPVRHASETLRHDRLSDVDRHIGERLLDGMDRGSIVTCRQHRDFTPWNTGITRDGILYVYDWEYSRLGYPVTHDLIHFASIRAVLRGSPPHRVIAVAHRAWERCRSEHRPSFDTSMSLWLLDTWALYASAWAESPVGSRTVLDWLAACVEHLRGSR